VIAICITEFPNVRRGSDVDSPLMDKDAFRERKAFGKDGRMIKHSISVEVNQSQDPMLRILELRRSLVRVPGTVRDIEHPILIETHVNGPLHQRRCGDTLQGIAFRDREGMRRKRD